MNEEHVAICCAPSISQFHVGNSVLFSRSLSQVPRAGTTGFDKHIRVRNIFSQNIPFRRTYRGFEKVADGREWEHCPVAHSGQADDDDDDEDETITPVLAEEATCMSPVSSD